MSELKIDYLDDDDNRCCCFEVFVHHSSDYCYCAYRCVTPLLINNKIIKQLINNIIKTTTIFKKKKTRF